MFARFAVWPLMLLAGLAAMIGGFALFNDLGTARRITSAEPATRTKEPAQDVQEPNHGDERKTEDESANTERVANHSGRKYHLGRQKSVPPSKSVTPSPKGQHWSQDDVDNAAQFVSAIQSADKAWSLCEAARQSWKPWLLGDVEREQFVGLMRDANRDATHVRTEVLARIHPLLPPAFGDFVNGTFCIGGNARDRRPDKGVQNAWQRWSRWRQTYWSQLHLPEGVRP